MRCSCLQSALRQSVEEAAQGEGAQVFGREQGEADQFVAFGVARVAAAEVGGFGVGGVFFVEPFAFEVALRLGVADEAAVGAGVCAEAGGGEAVDKPLYVGRGGAAAVGVVAFAERVEVAVGAVAFDD